MRGGHELWLNSRAESSAHSPLFDQSVVSAAARPLAFEVDAVTPAPALYHLGDLGGRFSGVFACCTQYRIAKRLARSSAMKSSRAGVLGVERGVQGDIGRRFTLAGVGRRPSPVRLGLVNLRAPRVHAASFPWSLDPLTIDRPRRFGAASASKRVLK